MLNKRSFNYFNSTSPTFETTSWWARYFVPEKGEHPVPNTSLNISTFSTKKTRISRTVMLWSTCETLMDSDTRLTSPTLWLTHHLNSCLSGVVVLFASGFVMMWSYLCWKFRQCPKKPYHYSTLGRLISSRRWWGERFHCLSGVGDKVSSHKNTHVAQYSCAFEEFFSSPSEWCCFGNRWDLHWMRFRVKL